jgi:hypothetical protein
MLGKSKNWIPLGFLFTVAWLNGTTKTAQSQEKIEFSPKSFTQDVNFSTPTDDFLDEEETFSLPIAQSESPERNRGGNIRRRPTENEEEFNPEAVPIIIPGLQELAPKPYKASPNISIVTPSGYGADWGSAGIGIGFQERARFTDDSDGVIGFGIGLGDSKDLVGLQVGLTLVDITDPFQDGSVSAKLHRRLPYDFSVAVGVQGGFTFGTTDGGSSVYGVVTKRFALNEDVRKPFSEIYTSVGIGGGQFRSESDINRGNETVGVFGSVAVRVVEPVSVITEWTGQDMTIGVSIVPFRNLPFVIVPAVTDVTGSAGDGARFILGAGYSFSF